jgi:DNA-binding beta-propeller fold protein YncE
MKNRSATFVPILFTLLISLVSISSSLSEAGDLPQFYTLQAGSYSVEAGARKAYQKLAADLEEAQRNYLRIEQIGSYYTVRVGKFEKRSGAKAFLGQTGEHLPGAVILQAFIKDERITRIYQPDSDKPFIQKQEDVHTQPDPKDVLVKEHPQEITEPSAVSDESAAEPFSPSADSFKQATEELPQFYTLQAGSYSIEAGAQKAYQKLAADLEEAQRAYLRIEQIGSYYTVRVGKFEKRSGAEALLGQTGEHLPGAVILQAFIKDERITRIYQHKADEAVHEIEQSLATAVQQPDVQPEQAAAMVTEAVIVEEQVTEQLTVETDVPPAQQEEAGVAVEEGIFFERLGQPNGLQKVRSVAVFSKDIFGGQYRFPQTVHYDPEMDEIYVVGGGGMHPSSRIMIYGPDYFPVASLGDGRGVRGPKGLTVDKEGNIYITQGGFEDKGPRLTVLNAAFFTMEEVYFNEMEGVPEGFTPQNIAMSEKYFYITGEATRGILVLDRQYNFKRWLVPMKVGGINEEVGDDPGHVNGHQVRDVVVDSNGRIYLLCPDQGRIFVLDAEWNFLFAFGDKGGSSGKLSRARSIAVDVERETIYVADYMRHTIIVYQYDGSWIFDVGGKGISLGWFNFPTHVEVDRRSNLIVADFFNNRVQVLFVP